MIYGISPWIEVAVNGNIVAPFLITDFGQARYITNATNPTPSQAIMIDTIEYGSAAAVDVTLFLAETAASAAELRKMVFLGTSAGPTAAPGNAGQQQYFTTSCYQVPRTGSGLPYQLFILKGNTNASIGLRFRWERGC